MTLTPSAVLAYGTTYTATVSGGTNSSGVGMPSPFSWLFTTLAPASVISETPASSASDLYNAGVPVSSSVSATFNEAVQASTINFSLTNSSGNSVAATATYNSSTDTVTMTPNADLAYGTTYTATVSAVNSLGLAMPTPYTFSFTTDAAPPTVIVESPASGATGVAVCVTPTASFNQSIVGYFSMQASTNLGFTLTSSSGTAVAGTFAYNLSTNSVTLTPSAAPSLRDDLHRHGQRRRGRGG